MNLASQSVLEGLNACLDHRGEVMFLSSSSSFLILFLFIQTFVPELNQSFIVPVGTRLFACQNPHNKGGGRKGLPKSFINRFIQVHSFELTCNIFHCHVTIRCTWNQCHVMILYLSHTHFILKLNMKLLNRWLPSIIKLVCSYICIWLYLVNGDLLCL